MSDTAMDYEHQRQHEFEREVGATDSGFSEWIKLEKGFLISDSEDIDVFKRLWWGEYLRQLQTAKRLMDLFSGRGLRRGAPTTTRRVI